MTENEARAFLAPNWAPPSASGCARDKRTSTCRAGCHAPPLSLPGEANSSNGQQFDRYVGPLDKLAQIEADTLKERIAALPLNPNKDRPRPPARPELAATSPGPAFHGLLATIPRERTGILRWAAAAGATLQIPHEQISYRLAFYRDQLAAAGVHLAQSTRYRALFVPTLGSDSGGYFSHIWREL